MGLPGSRAHCHPPVGAEFFIRWKVVERVRCLYILRVLIGMCRPDVGMAVCNVANSLTKSEVNHGCCC